MHSIIFAGGTLARGSAVLGALREYDLVIAADSGAATALDMGIVPEFVVGDFDSLPPRVETELRRRGSQFITAPAEKNETDTELAIQFALEKTATHITLLGALGGQRFEHSLANILLLASFETIPIQLVDGDSRGWLIRGPGTTQITGQPGDFCSLFPLTAQANGVRTENLYYPLRGESLFFGKPRGISNVLLTTQASVEIADGLLFVVHTTTSSQPTPSE